MFIRYKTGREGRQYSSIVAIHQLSRGRTQNDAPRANIGGLIKSFNHPSTKFSVNLTEKEIFANLYILLQIGSQAGRFYHEHVLSRVKSLDEAFRMRYSRFMSNERRDRLLYQSNNLRFSDFMKNSGVTRQSALLEICSIASSIQLQLGSSYQDPQHLRDALLTACKMKNGLIGY